MARSYRDVETAEIPTDTVLKASAEAALSILRSEAGAGTELDAAGARVWRVERNGPAEARFEISCIGPSLPTAIPPVVIRPGDIAKDRLFVGTWRLVVKAPILALDLYWSDGRPLRVMTYANGDWQQELALLCGAAIR